MTEMYDKVEEYYKTHGELYPDEVADALGLDLKDVMEAVGKLIVEGKLEVAD